MVAYRPRRSRCGRGKTSPAAGPQLSARLAVFRVVIPGECGPWRKTGFLLIADITGYTMFLTRSELEHAQGILDALFKSIFAEIKAPIILSNLQGDAALAHMPDEGVPQRQFPLDAIERIYCSFANTLAAMRLNTTCACNACRNMAGLDLKFFLHHGTYATQLMAGRTELQGAEVIRLHRLMKNSVTAATGIKAYALVTEQAAEAIGLPDFFAARDPSRRNIRRIRRHGLLRLRSRADVRALARRTPHCRCSPTSRWLSSPWNATCRCRRRSPGPMSPTSTRRSAGNRASTA